MSQKVYIISDKDIYNITTYRTWGYGSQMKQLAGLFASITNLLLLSTKLVISLDFHSEYRIKEMMK